MSHYAPYPEYEDSDIAWIDKIPSHWRLTRFKYVCELNPKKSTIDEGRDELCTFLPMEKLKTDSIVLDETRQISEVYEGYSYFADCDVLIAKVTPCFENENIAIAKDLVNGIGFGSTEINTIRSKDNCQNRFLYYRLQEDQFRKIAINAMTGTGGLKRVPSELFQTFKIAIPSFTEQALIAGILEIEANRIGTLIKKKTRFLELIKEKVLALVMNEQIQGSGEFDRLKRMTDVVSRPVTIIDGDEYVALGLYNRGRGLFHKPVTLGKDMGDSSFFYVEEGDLILSGQFAWEGAVTMATEKETGCVVSHRYPVIRGKSIATEYLFALFMTNFGDFLLNESSRGAAGRNRPLNINLLLNEKIRIPSPEVQSEVKRLMYLKAQADVKVKKSIALLKERRSAFITAAVTGKIDLRGEPA